MTLPSRDLVEALGHISRWNGHVYRKFSVRDHTVIGARLMRDVWGLNPRPFLLHDLHEAQFCGDVRTPMKRKYMNQMYHIDVEDWDADLYARCEVPRMAAEVATIDHIMMMCESLTISKVKVHEGHQFGDAERYVIRHIIGDLPMPDFWELWHNEASL